MNITPWKFLLLIFSFLNLILGLLAGLGRLGWSMPLPEAQVHHGAIMVGGFLGSLIALEKIIPLKRWLYYAGPLLSASSIVVFIFGNFQNAILMQMIASIIFIMVYGVYLKKQFDRNLIVAMCGACCWLTGNIMLAWNHFYPLALPWWMGFLLFTIISERLELSKFLPVTPKIKMILVAFLGMFAIGIILPFHEAGTYVAGSSLVFISLWLTRYDMIHITLKKEGLARYMAIALLCGYIGLLFTGSFLILLRNTPLAYDIIVHTFFLGFTFMMIFAHGPIILPGVLGLSVKPYHPVFYVPVAGLLISLVVRIGADVTLLEYSWRMWSGWISVGSIVLYFLFMLITTLSALRKNGAQARAE